MKHGYALYYRSKGKPYTQAFVDLLVWQHMQASSKNGDAGKEIS